MSIRQRHSVCMHAAGYDRRQSTTPTGQTQEIAGSGTRRSLRSTASTRYEYEKYLSMVPPDRLPLGAVFGLQDHRSHGEFELACDAQHHRGVEDTGETPSPLIRVEGEFSNQIAKNQTELPPRRARRRAKMGSEDRFFWWPNVASIHARGKASRGKTPIPLMPIVIHDASQRP